MLLTEDRISQVKEKYDIPAEVWEPMVSGSAAIAKNQKYLEWLAKVWSQYVSTPDKVEQQRIEGNVWTGSLNGLLTTIEEFDRVRRNLKKKDLYQYRDRQEVVDALEDWKKEKTRNIETHKESEVVFEDERFKVVVPESHTASCYYGAGTKWCTASKDSTHHFTNYDKSGKLFYILDKSAPTSNPYYKIALNKTYKGGKTYYDAVDTVIGDLSEIEYVLSHPDLEKTIREYFEFTYADEIAKISDEEKQKELERIARDAEWARRRREREQRLAALATQRREDDEWNYDEGTDEIGLSAHALMEYLKEDGEWNDKQSEIDDVEFQIEDLRSEMENDPEVIADPNGERAQDYGMDLNNLEEEIETLRQEAHDVYDIIYEEYRHYGLPVFEYDGAEYAVGDDKMADDAAYEQVESLIDEIGYTGFREGFADWYVDADVVANDFEDMFWEDMYDRPEDYLDEDEDMELTSDAKKDLENIDENIGNFMEELEETDDEFMREEIEDKISYLQSEKEEIEEDEDNYEFTQEAKENYVENQMQEVRNDPMGYLRDYGWDENIDRYIDKDAFIEGVLEYDSRGNGLSGYDGEEREVEFDDEWYYIYRIN